MGTTDLGFTHRYLPGQDPRTLLVLHGTGGDESDLLPLGQQLAPGLGLLSPRGKVLEGGMPRFFRRLAVGVFDQEDLILRTHELADFAAAAAAHYRFDAGKLFAAGYSNGANIAAATLLLRPTTLKGAMLFRPMVPLVPDPLPDLTGIVVYIAAGRQDPYASVADTERLSAMLSEAGASVTVSWASGGHGLTASEVQQAAHWFTILPLDSQNI